MTKIVSIFTLVCCWLNITATAQKNTMPAYRLFDNEGQEISYKEMIRQLSKFDVVFLGEIHNCPITHWLEYEITRSLYAIHKEKLIIGEEMLESDNQLILDEYMQGKITSDRFENEARLWDNYYTDYQPVVFFAKEHNIPLIATNIPRRYANSVKNHGLEFLNSFSEEAKRYIAPLPISFNYDEEKSQAAFGMMTFMSGKKTSDFKLIAQAQAIKDATMAWFIANNIQHHFLHINGSYHSDFKEGIIPYLLEYRPGTSVANITFVRQENINKLEDIQKGRADFYVCIPVDMVTSY